MSGQNPALPRENKRFFGSFLRKRRGHYPCCNPCCDGRDPRLCLRCGCPHPCHLPPPLRCASHTRASKPRDGLRFNICCSPRERLFAAVMRPALITRCQLQPLFIRAHPTRLCTWLIVGLTRIRVQHSQQINQNFSWAFLRQATAGELSSVCIVRATETHAYSAAIATRWRLWGARKGNGARAFSGNVEGATHCQESRISSTHSRHNT
jgi:hypothetical protein